jgi:hypothetical protein
MEDKAPAYVAVMDIIDRPKLLRLPDHFIPMQFQYKKTNIYVRDSYHHYFDILWNDLFEDQKDSVLITGTPGIGKSIFNIYVLEMMKVHLKDTVIVLASFTKQSQVKTCVILAPGQLPVRLFKGLPIPYMENAMYLYDGIPNVVEEGQVKTVIFASPNHDFLKEHSKNETMNRYYMPLMSEREILEAVELLKLRLEYEFIQKLFSRFGGSVRYILTEDEKFRKIGLQNQEKAINSIKSFVDLEKCLDLKMDDKDVIHRVFYFVPNINCPDEYDMRLGSIYIAFAVEANLKNADVQERLKFFRWLQSHGQSRSTAGWLFENYCHGILSSGINSVAKSLTAGANDLQLKMIPGYHRIFELESIEEMFRNICLEPDIPNLPAVGSYFIETMKRMVYLFQMTISRAHSIGLENLIYIMEKFELNKLGFSFALVFVVPSNIEKDFPNQRITEDDSFDDLKKLPVEQIHGIGPKSAMKLRSSPFNISSKYDFYIAAQDQALRDQMIVFIQKSYISNFMAMVDGVKQYKELANIPQFVLSIEVE